VLRFGILIILRHAHRIAKIDLVGHAVIKVKRNSLLGDALEPDKSRFFCNLPSIQLAPELEALINSATTERAILQWLKRKENKWILPRALKVAHFGGYAVPEFPFGTDYRADFVVVGPFSGGFDVQFIEMEPPNASLFRQDGRPAKRLAGALTQVRDWKIYVEKNRDIVLKELSKFAKKKEMPLHGRKSKMPLYHPKTCINWVYHIVIGRRSSLSEEHLEKKAAFYSTESVEVMTYDRLIDAAKRLDNAVPPPRVILDWAAKNPTGGRKNQKLS
jgi:hypothetical protein